MSQDQAHPLDQLQEWLDSGQIQSAVDKQIFGDELGRAIKRVERVKRDQMPRLVALAAAAPVVHGEHQSGALALPTTCLAEPVKWVDDVWLLGLRQLHRPAHGLLTTTAVVTTRTKGAVHATCTEHRLCFGQRTSQAE